MELSELLRYLAAALEELGLAYLVTGSMATIVFGEPRLTNAYIADWAARLGVGLIWQEVLDRVPPE